MQCGLLTSNSQTCSSFFFLKAVFFNSCRSHTLQHSIVVATEQSITVSAFLSSEHEDDAAEQQRLYHLTVMVQVAGQWLPAACSTASSPASQSSGREYPFSPMMNSRNSAMVTGWAAARNASTLTGACHDQCFGFMSGNS